MAPPLCSFLFMSQGVVAAYANETTVNKTIKWTCIKHQSGGVKR